MTVGAGVVALAVVAGLCLSAAIALWILPIAVGFSFQGRLTPDGRWALAGGAEAGPVSCAVVAARGVAPRVVVVVAGRRVVEKTLSLPRPERDPNRPSRTLAEELERAERIYRRVERFVDPAEVGLFLVQERRRVELGFLDAVVRFGADDVALTGKVTGAILVLDGILGGRISIRPDPVFSGEEVAEIRGKGRVRVWPARFVLDLFVFLVRHFHVLPPRIDAQKAKVTP